MMQNSQKKTAWSLLIIILLLGFALRLFYYSDFSLSNDELSALLRLKFSNFSDLIQQGVKVDGHPPLVQVFLFYWIKVFGNSEASIRFPFVLAGAISVFFIYLVAALWFNRWTGLFAALCLAVLQFPIMYSQLARPYGFGMLFSIINVWCWTRLLFFETENRKKTFLAIAYAFTFLACAYTHYFSFLFAIIVAISGLFFLRKSTSKYYLLAGAGIVLLFIPYYSIFLFQLKVGGVGTWLPVPEPDFIWKHLFYVFNESVLLSLLCAAIVLILILLNRKHIKLTRFHLLALCWFLIPMAIGYFYSVLRNPVLQHSVLLFSFPFLLLFLFSFTSEKKEKLNMILLSLLFAAGIYSLLIERKFYQTPHFGEFKGMAEYVIKWEEKYGEKNIRRLINISNPYYFNYYYAERFGKNPAGWEYAHIDSTYKLVRLMNELENGTTDYVAYGWSTAYSYPELPDVVKRYYPVLVDRSSFFNSNVYLFGKSNAISQVETKAPFLETMNDFENLYASWSGDTSKYNKAVKRSGNCSFLLDSLNEYSPAFSFSFSGAENPEDFYAVAASWIFSEDTSLVAEIVTSFEREGVSYDWYGVKLKEYVKGSSQWTEVFSGRDFPDDFKKGDILKIYVWNRGFEKIYLDDFEVKICEEKSR